MSRFRARLSLVAAVLAVTTALFAIPASTAEAVESTIEYEWQAGPFTTNWGLVADFPQFDPAFGELKSVTLVLDSTVDASMHVENTSTSSSCAATLTWGAKIDLGVNPRLMQLDLSAAESLDLEIFDGQIDFDGPSGESFTDLNMTGSDSLVLTGSDRDPFIGTGTIGIDVIANAAAGVIGCGSVQELFRTNVESIVRLTYVYESSPSIDIEKATNGEDADEETGPEILAGEPVEWTYVVTNTGDVVLNNIVVSDNRGVAVSCPAETLAPGESMECVGSGVAEPGQYVNIGSVTGEAPDGQIVSDEDASHYIGLVPPPQFPAIDIEKATNGEDADTPTGPEIPVGDAVIWSYVVTNTGAVPLENIVVTDDQGVAVTCPQDTLGIGAAMTCTGEGIAEAGQYANVGAVTGESRAGEVVEDDDASHYIGIAPGENPAIDIEKATNGFDADVPTGPTIPVGSPVDWTYVVTNTGDVPLTNIVVIDDQGVAVTCPADALGVGEAMTCTGEGIAAVGQYANLGSVTGESPEGAEVNDEDASHYLGFEPQVELPAIDIEKATNGFDADLPTGPEIPVGDPVEWTYVVTNTGDVPLSNVTVVDNQGVAVSCPQDTLAPNESMTCTGSGIAELGQYANIGSVTGESPEGEAVSDEDASHYFGTEPPPLTPAIDIEKATNGHDADLPTGPEIPVGDPVEWTYVVTNTGELPLSRVIVFDDQGVAVRCPQSTLSIGESMLCTGSGVAEEGQYANVGSVSGQAPDGQTVTDEDASHYIGVVPGDTPAIDIEKATNGHDADTPTGPAIPVGDPVLWTYVVTNTGSVPLVNVSVVDDRGVRVTCPQDTLGVGEVMTCTGRGVAGAGQYANIGSVTGEAPDGSIVSDADRSHYYGVTVQWWLKCDHGAQGCLGIRGEVSGDVEVLVDGEPIVCEVRGDGSGIVRFECMLDGVSHPATVDVEVYVDGQLVWTGEDLPTVCEITPVVRNRRARG